MAEGSQTFEQDIARLIRAGVVTREEGLAFSDSPTNLLWRLENDLLTPVRAAAKPEAADDGPSFTELSVDVHSA